MELSKNIFFNTDKLIENTVVKISYTGKFFQEGAEEVYIHYGWIYIIIFNYSISNYSWK